MTSSPSNIDRYLPLLQAQPGAFATPEQATLLEEAASLAPLRKGRWRRWGRLTDVWWMLEANVEGLPNWVKTVAVGDRWLLGENLNVDEMATALCEHLIAEMAAGDLPRVGFQVTSTSLGGEEPGVGLWYTGSEPGEVKFDLDDVGEAAWNYIGPHRFKVTHYRSADYGDGDDIDTLPLYENNTSSGRDFAEESRDGAGRFDVGRTPTCSSSAGFRGSDSFTEG